MNQQVEPVGTALVSLENARLPISATFAKNLDVTATRWRVLIDQIFPAAKSVEAIVMAISYCKERNLDVYKRPVHIVPMWSSVRGAMVEQVWPGISELRTTAFRTGAYAGMDEIVYGPMKKQEFTAEVERWVEPEGGGRKVKKLVSVTKTVEYPEWASVAVWRLVGGEPRAFHTRIYWLETYARLKNDVDVPNDMWAKRPIGQFDKCLEAAALRRAFPEEIGSEYAAEEMEGRTIDHEAGETAAPAKPQPPKPGKAEAAKPAPAKPTAKAEPKQEAKQEPSQELAGKDVEEADFGVADDSSGEVQNDAPTALTVEAMSKMVDAFIAEVGKAKTADDVEAVWQKHDLMAQFSHSDQAEMYQSIASSKYNEAIDRVEPQ